ncbi:MAG: glycoside hydrolase family 127 protein, partial [Clostridiales bacterium]|nr:glycoside hydrolase family 127 protein [Clostridiales bacterium]
MINVKSSKITDFILTPGFWADRQRMLSEITIYAVRDRFQETGRFDAMNCSWLTDMDKKPHVFWDSDIAKWVESVAYLIALGKNLDLQDDVEAVIDCIEANMDSTGYFNSYFLTIAPADRFTNRGDHELYTAGHLLEAAIAYYEATGRDRFLKLMMRNMDCIERAFVTEKTAHFITPGHEELELALFKLYKLTDDKKYFRLASFFIEERGRTFEPTHKALHPSYFQSHLPVREQTTAEGHSVRAVYLYCGMVDEALLAGDMELFNTCKTLFLNIVEKRMYITGGIGSSRHGECFTVDFDLPNLYAYTESCAAIGLVLFASRMLLIENNSIYSDTIERALYNGFLSSTSLSGDAFFYENPLEINEASRGRNTSIITDPEVLPPAQRSKVFNCSCCPPNITRFLALLGNLVYTESDDTIFVHQYMAGSSDALEIKTDYPLSGHIELNLKDSRKLAVRIPGWCEKYTITDKEG